MDDDLQAALRDHQQGRLDRAESAYEQIIARHPRHAAARNLLGVVSLQRGNYSRAIELIGQAVALLPDEPSFYSNLAEAYRLSGQFDRAIMCCETSLRLDPHSAATANNLGLARQSQGDNEGAISAFQKTLQLDSNFSLAHNNLGIALRQAGQIDAALDHFRLALKIDPRLPLAHSNLGQLLLEQFQREPALHHCREAVRLQPEFPEAHNNLGNVLRELGRLAEAREAYAAALRLNPNLALTCNNIGQAFQEEGKLALALDWYRRALELDNRSARIHSNLASLYQELEQIDAAASHYQQAIELDPNYPEAHHGLGWLLHDQGKFHAALGEYREALRLRPKYPLGLCSLGTLQQELGNLDEAEFSIREALRQDRELVVGHAELATLLRKKLPDDDLAALKRLAASPHLTDAKRSALCFGWAQVEDGRGAYDVAGQLLKTANALAATDRIHRGKTYDPAAHERLVTGVMATFTGDYFERVRGWGSNSRRPLFIIGLPRSGTTLTEQILASHSEVFGAGELSLAASTFHNLPRLVDQSATSWEAALQLDQPLIQRLAGEYLGRLNELHNESLHVVDKMPDNYLYLGLIVTLFPGSRIIHCRRDLRDIAVSCWMTNFRQIRWANEFDHIASRFRAYSRLMDHWRRTLPNSILEIDYEETVSDVEGTARRLLDWSGLEWESGCVDFYQQSRPVRTASVMQVRQPAYRTSVARWKNYESSLGNLFDKLAPLLLPESSSN